MSLLAAVYSEHPVPMCSMTPGSAPHPQMPERSRLPCFLLLSLWTLKRLQGKSQPSFIPYIQIWGENEFGEPQRCILLLQFSYCIIDVTVLASIMYSHKVSYMKGKVKANQSQSMCWSSRLAVKNYHDNRNYFFPGSQSPKLRRWQGSTPPGGSRGEFFPCLLASDGWGQCLVVRSLCILSSHYLLLPVGLVEGFLSLDLGSTQ